MKFPETITEPVHTYQICGECPHHKCVGSMHVRIGPGGWRDYNCMHPEAFDDLDKELTDPQKERLRQRLIGSMLRDGRNIGKTEKTPEWCPLKREGAEQPA